MSCVVFLLSLSLFGVFLSFRMNVFLFCCCCCAFVFYRQFLFEEYSLMHILFFSFGFIYTPICMFLSFLFVMYWNIFEEY